MTQATDPKFVKYAVYADLLPDLKELAALGYKAEGGIGWAVNFVLRSHTRDAILHLTRKFVEVATFRFTLGGFRFDIKVTALAGTPEAETGINLDPRLLPGLMQQATQVPSPALNAHVSHVPATEVEVHTTGNPGVNFMNSLFG